MTTRETYDNMLWIDLINDVDNLTKISNEIWCEQSSKYVFMKDYEYTGNLYLDYEALKDSDWFYVEGYLVTDEARTRATKQAVEFAKEQGVKIAISLSDPFVVDVFGDALRDVIGSGVDLVFCNKDEALAFTSSDGLDSAIEKLKLITKSFAITDGAKGAITYDGDSVSKSDGVSAKAIDTNGAGDMFAGAFLYAITSGKSYDWAAKLANDCASRVVAKFGPRLDLEELDVIKAKFGL